MGRLRQSPTMKTLQDWLAHCERLHPQEIDMGLERVRAVAQRLQLQRPQMLLQHMLLKMMRMHLWQRVQE